MENIITKEKAIDIMSRIDHTQLKAFATWEDIKSLCDEAVLYKTASVCIPPGYVKKPGDSTSDRMSGVLSPCRLSHIVC
jgi:deoxyribose-phosphate aldolase